MAFDYGSIDLGLKNPFKLEGAINTLRGLIVSGLGVYLLIFAAGKVGAEPVVGWITVIFGLGLLGNGITTISGGLVAMMRYFVGRSQPTSLARNYSRSESSTSGEEVSYVAYTKQKLIEMLVGRKNSTFVEPQGFLARLLHSFFPRLTYMPYPVRNMAQLLFGAWIKTLTALVVYALVAFVSLAGFAGEIGKVLFPIYSVALVIYLLLVWRGIGNSINRTADKKIPTLGSMVLAKTIAFALILPVIIGLGLQFTLTNLGLRLSDLIEFVNRMPNAYSFAYLISALVGALIVSVIVTIMLVKRLKYADPKVEVSELRENWQESVHPNEVFINLDNLVMANRRYKEVPNRVYQELDPVLNEQVDGKGSFFGEMVQEIQPQFKPMNLGGGFKTTRLVSLLLGNAFFVGGSIITLFLAIGIANAYSALYGAFPSHLSNVSDIDFSIISEHGGFILHLFLIGLFVRAFARILTNSAHLFFAEMMFESNLIYFKVEGTFTESKIATGTGINDSTRSENTLVRSSLTPWVVVSRVVSSTFAASGMKNLEHARYIMEMHKNDVELDEIKSDVISFLKDRESIAAITSERDLQNTSQIHQINQQSRSLPTGAPELTHASEPQVKIEEAAGYLRREEQEEQSNPA